MLGLFVPVLGVVAVVVAARRDRQRPRRARGMPGARLSALLWLGLALGLAAVAIVAYAAGQSGPPAIG